MATLLTYTILTNALRLVLLLNLFSYFKHIALLIWSLLSFIFLFILWRKFNTINWWQWLNAHPFVNTIDELLILSYFLHELANPCFIKINLAFVSRLPHISTQFLYFSFELNNIFFEDINFVLSMDIDILHDFSPLFLSLLFPKCHYTLSRFFESCVSFLYPSFR